MHHACAGAANCSRLAHGQCAARNGFNGSLVESSQANAFHGQNHVVTLIDLLDTGKNNVANVHVLTGCSKLHFPGSKGHGEQALERTVDVHEPQVVAHLGHNADDQVTGTGHVGGVDGVDRHRVVSVLQPPQLSSHEVSSAAMIPLPARFPVDGPTAIPGVTSAARRRLDLGTFFSLRWRHSPTHDKGHPKPTALRNRVLSLLHRSFGA